MNNAIKQAAFDKIRVAIITKRAVLDAIRSAIDAKYGWNRWQFSWLSTGERARLDRAKKAYDKACDRMYKLLEAAPRDWKRGVPTWWVCEKLTFEDATAPIGATLSIEPPSAFDY